MEMFFKHLALFGLLLFNFLEVTQSTAESPSSSGGLLQAFANLLKPDEAKPPSSTGLGGFAKWTTNFIKKWVPQASPPLIITPDTSLPLDKKFEGTVEGSQLKTNIVENSQIAYEIFNTTVNCKEMDTQPKLVCGNKTEINVTSVPLICYHMTVDDRNNKDAKHECSELIIIISVDPDLKLSCKSARFYKNENMFCETASLKTESTMINWTNYSIINGKVDYTSMSENKIKMIHPEP